MKANNKKVTFEDLRSGRVRPEFGNPEHIAAVRNYEEQQYRKEHACDCCNGDGYTTCPHCEGEGTLDCEECEGKGIKDDASDASTNRL